ncbi:MAG TPA: RNA 2',3'-cyclic phosphodiesterase [Jatrophihabitans sp.]|jgi:2'-5' RNA ligase|nr:RNA 2',3'-cyclic phosphodiesterase [Jatrophihabitans sp.]
MRMFLALTPPAEVLEQLADYLQPRQDADGPLRWSRVEQWHITLAFMPAVPDRALDPLDELLTELAADRQSFELALAGAGAFPDPARAKALWMGVTGELEPLHRLATATRAAAVRAGIEVAGGRFRPHLTVARANRPVEATRWLRILDLHQGRTWTVDSFALVHSQLGGAGSRTVHQERAQYRLGKD